MPRLARILIYPLKSFDPVSVDEAQVLPSGALEHDRRFALFDAEGKFVNGKRVPKVLSLRASFDLGGRTITFGEGNSQAPGKYTFHLDEDRRAVESYLSGRLGISVTLREEPNAGFPDDTEAPGPTIISSGTLTEVAGWYRGISVDEARRRFRANLEIETEEPFGEDRLYTEAGAAVRFRIGAIELLGTNPCQRCAVPTRSSRTGERTPEFTSLFEARRLETLPSWATRSRFNHFYRLAVNTRPASTAGGRISVGDEISIIGPE